MARVLVISDTQAPFQHPKTISFLKSIYKKHKCDKVVHIGDEVDNKFLKFLSVNDPYSAEQQHFEALRFMEKLYDAFPECLVCHSNHVNKRLISQAEVVNIPEFMLKTPKEYLKAPSGYIWKDYWDVDNVRYEHGHRFSGQKPHEKAVEANHMSTVIGHHPVSAIRYFIRNNKIIFAMAVGALTVNLADARMGWGMAYAKKYANHIPPTCGVVIDGEYAYIEPLHE